MISQFFFKIFSRIFLQDFFPNFFFRIFCQSFLSKFFPEFFFKFFSLTFFKIFSQIFFQNFFPNFFQIFFPKFFFNFFPIKFKTACGSIRCASNRPRKVPKFKDCSICSIIQTPWVYFRFKTPEKSYIFYRFITALNL